MPSIETPEELEDWLQGQPQSVSAVMASRIALRVVPGMCDFVSEDPKRLTSDILLATFRALAQLSRLGMYGIANWLIFLLRAREGLHYRGDDGAA